MDRNYAKKLKTFADDLASDNFESEIKIKEQMEALGLTYCEDELERLNRVLLALHPIAEKIKNADVEAPHKEMNH